MGKLFFLSIIIFNSFLCVFGQVDEPICPEISIAGVPGGYMGRGENLFLSVALGRAGDYDSEKLKYEWSFSEKVPFETQGKPYVSFIAKEEFDGLEVKVTLKVTGLPEKCENTVSDKFTIQFNPGTPVTLERYGNLTFSMEKIKLDNVVSGMKERGVENSMALFIIYYDKKDTKLNLKNRILRISNYLMTKHKLSKNKFNFVLGGTDVGVLTQVYLVPKGKGFEDFNWEEWLKNTDDKTSKKSQ